MTSPTATAPELLRRDSTAGRWVLAATVLGAGVTQLTGTVVNVALPAIGDDLGAGVTGLQWIVNGYLLALAALILLGGSLGDRLGRRRMFVIGTIWFALASAACAVAPTLPLLVSARVLQGIGAALLTPGSLAIIQASFVREDRAAAIGAWSALGGVAGAIGPPLGGWLVEAGSWRWVFLLNLPLAVGVLVAARHVPESRDPDASGPLDVTGAALGAGALAAITWGCIALGSRGLDATVAAALAVGVAAAIVFVVVERRRPDPMLPPAIFSSATFTWANVLTFLVYGALGVLFFLLVVFLQQAVGYRPVLAGLAGLPITVLLFLLSARGGELAQRIGPRRPLAAGALTIAAGFALLSRLGPGASYVTDILPALVALGLGLCLTVAPVTATVLAAADDAHSGLASGVNNAVARTAGLVAIAVVPAIVGLGEQDYADPEAFTTSFRAAMWLMAGLSTSGAVVAWLRIPDDVLDDDAEPEHPRSCAVDAPPVRIDRASLRRATGVGATSVRAGPGPAGGGPGTDPSTDVVCGHLDRVGQDVSPHPVDACGACLAAGTTWVALRMCATCGLVGCCDTSPGAHATRHAREADHPVMRSYHPGESWWWCDRDEVLWEVDGIGPLR